MDFEILPIKDEAINEFRQSTFDVETGKPCQGAVRGPQRDKENLVRAQQLARFEARLQRRRQSQRKL